mgnify:CR=1 FL=1
MTLEGPVCPSPVDQHHQAIAKPDQEVDVHEQPEHPGRVAAEAQLAEQGQLDLRDRVQAVVYAYRNGLVT